MSKNMCQVSLIWANYGTLYTRHCRILSLFKKILIRSFCRTKMYKKGSKNIYYYTLESYFDFEANSIVQRFSTEQYLIQPVYY